MFEWHLIRPLIPFLLLQIVAADVEVAALRYIAGSLLPNQCESVINNEVGKHLDVISPASSPSYKTSSDGIDCFENLVNWASNIRINRRDTNRVLGNRLRQIGRNDLAACLVGLPSRGNTATEETFEYESWDSKKESSRKLMSSSNPTISETDSLDSFKDRSLFMAEPESEHSATLTGEYVTSQPSGHHQDHGDASGTHIPKENVDKHSKSPQAANGKPSEGNKHEKSKFAKIFPHFSDDKTAPCLRVPLSTALVVIGTIMVLTCGCALLLRNRLAACFERLRGKKNKPSRRMSTDEEQGFMGPKTFGKVPKRSGRKGGGPTDVVNVGVQNNSSNGSKETDEKPTGCCSCCTRKKKKNRKKWKK